MKILTLILALVDVAVTAQAQNKIQTMTNYTVSAIAIDNTNSASATIAAPSSIRKMLVVKPRTTDTHVAFGLACTTNHPFIQGNSVWTFDDAGIWQGAVGLRSTTTNAVTVDVWEGF